MTTATTRTTGPHTTTLLLATAGAAWTAGQAVLPDMGATTVERYERVAAHPGTEALSAALLLVAAVALVLGGLSAARRTPHGPGHRLVLVGAHLVALGGIWLAAGRAAFNLQFLALSRDEVPRETALAVLDGPGSPAFVPLVLTLPCLLVGPALLGVGVHRAGLGSWLGLVLWVVGIGVFIGTEFAVKAGEVAGIATASCGLVVLGRALARVRGSEAGAARGVALAAEAVGQ